MPQMLVSSIHDETENIKAFELVDPQSSELQGFSAGSHIEIELPGNLKRHYSLCNDPSETPKGVQEAPRPKISQNEGF